MPVISACQCPLGGSPCSGLITQEDLLCDSCRVVRKGDAVHMVFTMPDARTWPHAALFPSGQRAPEGA